MQTVHAALFVALLFAALRPMAAATLPARQNSTAATLSFTVLESETEHPMPARIHLRNPAGKPVRPPNLPFWHDHFVCEGQVQLEVAPGEYAYEIERGPEFSAANGRVTVATPGGTNVTVILTRLVDLAREGWWSGDLHVHRSPADAELLMRAEDLHVAPFITWWNKQVPAQFATPNLPVRFDGNRYYHPMAGEDEREGGALLFFNLDRPLEITRATRHYPLSTVFARRARMHRGVWIDLEKPFWWDLPLWLAEGVGDSVGLANNHLQRSGMLDSEAWGRARDRSQYPPAWGNGLWTQDIYYHLLNCGFRLPPSAGSASGVLPNPVGYNRVYAFVPPNRASERAPASQLPMFAWDEWWQALRAGRCFVGNGPLLRVRANGQVPGHVFQSPGPLMVQLDIQVAGRDHIRAVEWVHNGQVERVPFPRSVTIHESGWFLVRAIADVTNTFRFASSAPWYVEIGGHSRPVQRASAQFFLNWSHERLAMLEQMPQLGPAQKEEVRAGWSAATQFWRQKLAAAPATTTVTGQVVDATSGAPIPSRVYLQRADGRWYYPQSAVPHGSAVRYERRNWVNTNAVEYHTTLSAHPFRFELEPGRYTLTVERGKEYRPLVQTLEIGGDLSSASPALKLPLRRWVNMAARGWFSGDTHVHRAFDELPNVMLAEDLNVAFPLTYWVTKGFAPPLQGDKASGTDAPEGLIRVDDTHVIWPRNTEWEIFSLGARNHTLGAVFALGHRAPFTHGAPPVRPLASQARSEGALLDLDKHDWPWSLVLPPVIGVDLFPLANNHHWRTEFGFTNWSSRPAPYMGFGSTRATGNEREWTLYGWQTYYALLNCGFRLRPSAGTASGVHPVPLGFSRVYVHLPEGFSYDQWRRGLDAGRSFVTTGPMLLITVNGQDPGVVLPAQGASQKFEVTGTVLSAEPLAFLEIVHNGESVRTIMPQNRRTTEDAYETRFRELVTAEGSGWLAVRCWEDRPGDRARFAHTAPWHIEAPGRPLQPRREEQAFLVRRVRDELARSRALLPPEAVAEYQTALDAYERIVPRDDSAEVQTVARRPSNAEEQRYWLENMIRFHRFTPEEVRLATGLTLQEIATAVKTFGLDQPVAARAPGDPLRVFPYPGGRHPRIGFLEGAIRPQRETKISVFTPWNEANYVVVDVPEAIWSNLGLTYLAHTHIDTIWTQRGVTLEPREWQRHPDGTFESERTLPNGIAFGTRVIPGSEAVRMEIWLRNGSREPLRGLRMQNCVMLKGTPEFAAQTGANKVMRAPYAACRSLDGQRWVITAWDPLDAVWQNPPVPCFHSNPKFPDCAPGQTVRARGWLSFYQGTDIQAEFDRIERTGWRR